MLDLTPAMLAELYRQDEMRSQARDSLLEYMLAQQIAMTANTGFKGWKEPRQPREFMPSERMKDATPAGRRRKAEARWASYSAAVEAYKEKFEKDPNCRRDREYAIKMGAV